MDRKAFETIYDEDICLLPSIDDLQKKFDEYQKRRDAELKTEIELLNESSKGFEKQYSELRKEIQVMRNNLSMHITVSDDEKKSNDKCYANGKTLEVTCKSTTCVFEKCGRRMDSQLMLIHYLCDHGALCAYNNCHELIEGDCANICFSPRVCQLRQNMVLGLLAFGGSAEDKLFGKTSCPVFYNSFLTEQYEHLESHIPVMVMLCKTGNSATLKDRDLAKRIAESEESKDHIFVIWLFTPSNQKINATLTINGPNENFRRSTIIALRQMCDSQITEEFMSTEHNYWRLTYADVEQMSNSFKHKLYLKVSLIRCTPT